MDTTDVVSFVAGQGISLEGGTVVDLHATDIVIAADAGFAATGTATVDISGPLTTIEGKTLVSVQSTTAVKLN